MADDAAIALAQAASTIYAAARSHKRLEAMHRRQARELMIEFDRVKRACERAGVHIETTETRGGHSDRAAPETLDDRPARNDRARI